MFSLPPLLFPLSSFLSPSSRSFRPFSDGGGWRRREEKTFASKRKRRAFAIQRSHGYQTRERQQVSRRQKNQEDFSAKHSEEPKNINMHIALLLPFFAIHATLYSQQEHSNRMLRLKRKELPPYSIFSLLLWYTCSSLYLLPLLQNFFPLSFFARLFLRGGGGGGR